MMDPAASFGWGSLYTCVDKRMALPTMSVKDSASWGVAEFVVAEAQRAGAGLAIFAAPRPQLGGEQTIDRTDDARP